MKMAVLVLIIHPADPGLLRPGRRHRAGRAGITNPGFHGLEPGAVRVLFFRRQQRLWL